MAAYYELINGPSPDRKPAEMQQAMFPTGDDLPLFTSKRTEE